MTPAVRPGSVWDFLGPVDLVGDFGSADATGNVSGLPTGMEVPADVIQTLVMAERITQWLKTGRRVRAWADSLGHGNAPWIVPDLDEQPPRDDG